MATIYRKTAKGVSEIETRAHRLTPRMRSALILVDGRRSDDDLRALVLQQCDETLLGLVAQGFIEVVSVSDSAAMPLAPARPVAAAAPATAPAPAPASWFSPLAPPATVPASLAAEIQTLRRDAVRALNDQLGPLAEALAIRMERARSVEELKPLIESAAQMVANVRGAQAGADYRARFLNG